MLQRLPSFADRLRSALGHDSDPTTTPVRPPVAGGPTSKRDEFAKRLRRAVAARH